MRATACRQCESEEVSRMERACRMERVGWSVSDGACRMERVGWGVSDGASRMGACRMERVGWSESEKKEIKNTLSGDGMWLKKTL